MAEPTSAAQVWARGDLYEAYVGRWSRLVAREFLQWLGARNGQRWLDVGCGTGVISQTILETAAPTAVVGIDRSEQIVAYAHERVNDSRAQFRVGDAEDLKTERGEFDAVVSGLVLNFVSSPAGMVTQMTRACRLNGKVGLYLWDYAGEMQLMRHFWDAAIELDPAAAELDEGARFPLAQRKPLWNLFLDAGLNDVLARAIDVPTHFESFDDYWNPFLSGQAPAPHYTMSLSEEKRVALRERLRERLPHNADGSIDLIARAWAVKGSR